MDDINDNDKDRILTPDEERKQYAVNLEIEASTPEDVQEILDDNASPDVSQYGGTWEPKQDPVTTETGFAVTSPVTMGETAKAAIDMHKGNAEIGKTISTEIQKRIERKKQETILNEVQMLMEHVQSLHKAIQSTQREIDRYTIMLNKIEAGEFEIDGMGRLIIPGMWPPR